MKNIIKKHWALIGFIFAFALDTQFGLLESLIGSEQWVNIIRGLGAIILAYFWQNENAPMSTRGLGGRPNDRQPKKP
jgi:1,4-dihydroxy-2-naphthoate octaprenyltransferase